MNSFKTKQRELLGYLYILERQFGLPWIYRKKIPGPPNLSTGDYGTPVITDVKVLKGVTTSADVVRRTEYEGLLRVFKVGGYLENWDRLFILRSSYVSSISQEKDQIIYNNQIYRIEKFTEMDYEAGWVILARHMTGENDGDSC